MTFAPVPPLYVVAATRLGSPDRDLEMRPQGGVHDHRVAVPGHAEALMVDALW